MENIDETKIYFIEKINQIKLMSNFASLVGILIDTTSSAVGLIICAKTTEIKKYDLIAKKNSR